MPMQGMVQTPVRVFSMLIALLILSPLSATAQQASSTAPQNASGSPQSPGPTVPYAGAPAAPQATAPGAPPSATPAVCAAATTTVRGVYKGHPDSERKTREGDPSPTIALGDTITVLTNQLPSLLAEAECRKSGQKVTLFLDGKPMVGVPINPPSNPAGELISFLLVRNAATQGFWDGILGAPEGQFRSVAVSVGLNDRFALPSNSTVNFNVVPAGLFLTWVGVLAVALVLFATLASRSNLLRDSNAQPDPMMKERAAFSAARVQAAFWFFVVLCCYLFISVITGDFLRSMTTGALAILGLAAATAAGSASIDAAKDTHDVRVQNAGVVSMAAAFSLNQPGGVPADPEKKYALDQAAAKARGASQGFLIDVLSDVNGVSFQRFQLLVWTVVLGIIFCWTTWKSLALPPLDAGLLGTYFVSSATFLSLKLPEPTVPRMP
jgi:hypothetical protein